MRCARPDPAAGDLRRFTLPGGWEVLVGRNDAANDALSLRLARPGDYWFHVRGLSGSHVVLRCPPKAEGGREPDRTTLKAAAALAAHFSKARNAGIVAVSCTRARFVTKPRAARPGTVQIRGEITLKVRPGLGEAVAADLPVGE
jgi:predicted ribosome quality control (RQC) complex YloA/Tae2 family protein